MIGQTFAIARNTFLESVRQPIFFVLLMAGWLLQVLNTLLSGYSLGYSDSSEVSSDNKMLLDMGLATVFVVATLLAAFLATAVLSREIENKTAMTVISKPIGRPMFVIGKYLGVTAAIVVATIILLVFFQFALRHQVLSTARDKVDGPVLLFSLLAIGLSIGVGVWCNFFYGSVFSSTTVLVLLPASLLAWLAVLMVSKKWEVQPITTNLKPEILLASACLIMAMLVLCAVAVAASTRLGQVMTLAVCVGVFLLGLLSNHLIGRHAFRNEDIGRIKSAVVERDIDGDFLDAGDIWRVELLQSSSRMLRPAQHVFFGPAPNGLAITPTGQRPFTGDPTKPEEVMDEDAGPALVVRSVEPDQRTMTWVNVGGIALSRPPREQDYVFLTPTRINGVAWGAWAIVPNVQFYWLVDAVTQSHRIPGRYVGLVALYTVVQVTGLLALGVMLFQTREVG